MDDILLIGNDPNLLQSFIFILQKYFVFKELGSLDYFLGIEASHTYSSLVFTQKNYISDLLSKAKKEDCKPISAY